MYYIVCSYRYRYVRVNTGFCCWWEIALDGISGQEIGICVVWFGVIVVFVFWYFDIGPNTY